MTDVCSTVKKQRGIIVLHRHELAEQVAVLHVLVGCSPTSVMLVLERQHPWIVSPRPLVPRRQIGRHLSLDTYQTKDAVRDDDERCTLQRTTHTLTWSEPSSSRTPPAETTPICWLKEVRDRFWVTAR